MSWGNVIPEDAAAIDALRKAQGEIRAPKLRFADEYPHIAGLLRFLMTIAIITVIGGLADSLTASTGHRFFAHIGWSVCGIIAWHRAGFQGRR